MRDADDELKGRSVLWFFCTRLPVAVVAAWQCFDGFLPWPLRVGAGFMALYLAVTGAGVGLAYALERHEAKRSADSSR
jgi:hypothetical protein